MRLGYAHQSNGALAVAQAVKELLEGKVKRITFVIARKDERRILETFAFGIGRDGDETAVRFLGEGGDPFGAESHALTRFDKTPPDPVVVAAVLAEFLAVTAANHRGEVFRPLADVNPEHPVFGAFHTVEACADFRLERSRKAAPRYAP
jgi:hypothetical protein